MSVLIAGSLLLVSQALHAVQWTQAPSSFADVAATDDFCTDVQWLKNRGVTVGCLDGAVYCPSLDVARSSMALLMKRLAEKILPEPILIKETISNRTVTVLPPENQFCLVTGSDEEYPRAFSMTGSVHICGNPTSPEPISAAVRLEDDGGAIMAIDQVDATITSGVELHLPIVMLTKLGPGPKTFG